MRGSEFFELCAKSYADVTSRSHKLSIVFLSVAGVYVSVSDPDNTVFGDLSSDFNSCSVLVFARDEDIRLMSSEDVYSLWLCPHLGVLID